MRYLISLIIVSVLLIGCTQSDYTKLVKSELAKGSRQDSLLLGIYFGDSNDEFFGKCFDLNKQMLVSQGPSNSSVQYNFTDSLFHSTPTPIRLLFFPAFDKNQKLSNIDLEFSYSGWAPWNRVLQSDSLVVKVKKILMNWYEGNEFVEAHIDGKTVPVKLDLNRRMIVNIKDDQSVIIHIQDILHPKFQHSISK